MEVTLERRWWWGGSQMLLPSALLTSGEITTFGAKGCRSRTEKDTGSYMGNGNFRSSLAIDCPSHLQKSCPSWIYSLTTFHILPPPAAPVSFQILKFPKPFLTLGPSTYHSPSQKCSSFGQFLIFHTSAQISPFDGQCVWFPHLHVYWHLVFLQQGTYWTCKSRNFKKLFVSSSPTRLKLHVNGDSQSGLAVSPALARCLAQHRHSILIK